LPDIVEKFAQRFDTVSKVLSVLPLQRYSVLTSTRRWGKRRSSTITRLKAILDMKIQ